MLMLVLFCLLRMIQFSIHRIKKAKIVITKKVGYMWSLKKVKIAPNGPAINSVPVYLDEVNWYAGNIKLILGYNRSTLKGIGFMSMLFAFFTFILEVTLITWI